MKFVSLDSAIRGSISSMTRGHLHVMVKEAHNLSPSRGTNASPFCKRLVTVSLVTLLLS